MRLKTRRGYGVMLFLLGVVLSIAIAGCDSGGDDDDVSLAGTWSGTIQDSISGAGTGRVTIAQSGSTLSGTWEATFADPANNNGGTLSGTFDGQSIDLTLSPSDPASCPFRVTATLQGDNRFTGTYAAFDCTVVVTGNLDVTRQ